jgi:hypothetical protein
MMVYVIWGRKGLFFMGFYMGPMNVSWLMKSSPHLLVTIYSRGEQVFRGCGIQSQSFLVGGTERMGDQYGQDMAVVLGTGGGRGKEVPRSIHSQRALVHLWECKSLIGVSTELDSENTPTPCHESLPLLVGQGKLA